MQPREESVRGCVATVQFSRAVREGVRVIGAMGGPGELRRSLKTQQHATRSSSTVCRAGTFRSGRHSRPIRRSRSRWAGDDEGRRRARARFRSGSVSELPRKEVIQPQLPLRLPCYDFTPVTGPTFDGFLPKGLDHRLRVLPTPVV
jgi:hypothetical protein